MKEGTIPLNIEGTVGKMKCHNTSSMTSHSTIPTVLVRGAVKTYNQRIPGLGGNVTHVLRGLNMTVPSGTIYGLLGASGCGKTTLLKSVIGQTDLDAGAVLVLGRRPRSPGSGVPGRAIGYMPQELALYAGFTVSETLRYFGWLTSIPRAERRARVASILRLLQLPKDKRFVGDLSGGQQRRVSFAVALLHRPPLLILDEPTVGVDPVLRQKVHKQMPAGDMKLQHQKQAELAELVRLKRQREMLAQCIWEYLIELTSTHRTTVIITTHYIEEARQAHCIGLMRRGVLLAEAPPEVLLRRIGSDTLEDAFLKLCVQQQRSSLPHDNNHNLQVVSTGGDGSWPRCIEGSVTSEEAMGNERLPPPFKGSSNSHLRCLLWKQCLWLWRNLVMVGFLVFLPLCQCCLLAWSVGNDPQGLHLAVSNEEANCRLGDLLSINGTRLIDCTAPSGLSCVLQRILAKKTFVQDSYDGIEDARMAVERGRAWGAVHFGPNFTQGLVRRILDGGHAEDDVIEMSTADIWMDMSNQYIGQMMRMDLTMAMLEMIQGVMADCDWNPRSAGLPVRLETPIYGTVKPVFLDFVAAGATITLIFFMALASAVGCLIAEKNEGLLDRSLVTGVSLRTVLWSHIVIQLVIIIVQAAIVLVTFFVVFGIRNDGPMVWILLLCYLQGVCGMCLGMLVSSVCKTDMEATLLSMGSFFPFIFLSGMLWPVEGMHWTLQKAGWALPLTLATTALRCMMSRGWSINRPEVYLGFVSTAAWIAIFLGSTLFIIRSSRR